MKKNAVLGAWGSVVLAACAIQVAGCGGPLRLEHVAPLSSAEKAALKARAAQGDAITPTEAAARSADVGSTTEAVTPQQPNADECKDFRAKLPSDYVQDTVTVPEDWDQPQGRQIHVFYYTAKSGDGRIPVVFFNGGPGASSHSSYDVLAAPDAGDPLTLGKKLRFIFIDQRGTGCSDAYPNTADAETAQRLTHYGSRAIVKDAEAVRVKLLGADGNWKAFGQSYGGYIVHRYVEVAPEHLLGAYAHGSSIEDDQILWLSQRIESQYRVSKDYFAQFPEDQGTLDTLRSLMPARRCFTDDTATVCGPALFDAATILMGFHDSWPELHKWVGAMLDRTHQDQPRFYENQVLNWARYVVFGTYDDNTFLGGVIGQAESSTPGLPTTPEQCDAANALLVKKGYAPQAWTINECRLLSAMTTPYDALEQALPLSDPFRIADVSKALASHATLPFYLYSGHEDVFVPIETFDQEVQALGARIHYTSFPKTGHDGFFTEPQVWADLSE